MTTSMFGKVLALLVCTSCVCASSTIAQVDLTGAGRSYAQVDQKSGQVDYWNSSQAAASSGGRAMLAVRINGKYYVNTWEEPRDGSLLPDAVFERRNDSLVTRWVVDGCAITQIVYPYQTGEEYKMVTRYFATALSAPVTIEAQGILGARGVPLTYQKAKPYPLDTYFDTVPSQIAFMSGPYETEIYWRFPPHPVMKPREMLYGDPQIVSLTLNWDAKKTERQNTSHGFGVNMLWDSVQLVPGITQEIGSYIYGAAEYVVCNDSISATLFFPRLLVTPANDTASRTLPLYAYFDQADENYRDRNPADGSKATLKTSHGLSITSLSLIQHPDSVLRVLMQKDDKIGGWSTAFAIDLYADTSSKPSISRDLEIGIDPYHYPVNISGCKYSIGLTQRKGKDLVGPLILDQTRDLNSGDCRSQRDTLLISDMATVSEKGIKSIEDTSENYDVRYPIQPQPLSASQSVVISVKDSMRDGYVIFNVVDGEEHTASRQIDYCTTPDILKPVGSLTTNSAGDWVVNLSDDRPWDRRLRKVRLLEAYDIQVTERVYFADSATAMYRIHPISNSSRFTMIAEDRAGNISDTISASLGSGGVDSGDDKRLDLPLYPNPASNTITLEGMHDGDIMIRDILGNVITSYHWLNERTISVKDLPSGKYFVVVGEKSIPFTIER